MPEAPRTASTEERILEAARTCLLDVGYAALSTRAITEQAGVPLSQLHYHFGSKQGLVLALLDRENARRLQRQQDMYGSGRPLWKRWEQACEYLEDDLSSGYVRVLQEMIAAGWSDEEVADAVREDLRGWFDVITEVATEAAETFGGLGSLTPEQVAGLAGTAFLGAEEAILLGFDESELPVRAALQAVGDLIRQLERAKH